MFELLLARLAEAFEAEALPYMIIGGQAVLLYGEPRLTRVVDVTVGADVSALSKVLAVAGRVGVKPRPADPGAFVAETLVLPCEDPGTGIRVDFVFSSSEYEATAIGRVRLVTVGGRSLAYASPEDLIIHKLVAGRPRDLDDIRSVRSKMPGLDMDYIETWIAWFENNIGLPMRSRWESTQRD